MPHMQGQVSESGPDEHGHKTTVLGLLEFSDRRPVWSAALLHALNDIAKSPQGTLSPPDYPHAAEDVASAVGAFLAPRLAGASNQTGAPHATPRRLRIAVWSAITPWVEVGLFNHPALLDLGLLGMTLDVTTVEYNQPLVAPRYGEREAAPKWVNQLHTLSQADLAMHYAKGVRYDAIISFSGIEHDGLSRYGDPPNPTGDFAALAEMGLMLSPGGVLLLSVPTGGVDDIVFPSHRIYGPKRLQQLLLGWTLHGRVWGGKVVQGGLEVADAPPTIFPNRTKTRDGFRIAPGLRLLDWQHEPVLALTRD